MWANNADHTCWLDDPLDDGEMVGRARRVQAGRVVLVERIMVWEQPAVAKSAVNEWRLGVEPADNERTIVTLSTNVDCGHRPPQQLIARVVGRRLAGASDTMLKGLAGYLAADASVPPGEALRVVSTATDSKGTPT